MERNPRVIKNLNAAVDAMRLACEEAARAIASGGDEVACQRVLHALAWGFANASSGIEAAMAAIEDGHEMQVERLMPANVKVTGSAPTDLQGGAEA